MTDERSPKLAPCLSRRDFLIVGSAGVATAVAASGLAQAADTKSGVGGAVAKTYPVLDVAPLSSIAADAPVSFNYPDADSPATLVMLPASAPGGVGPDNRIVAYSILCTHKGCPVNYLPERKMFVCPCHWSSFDPAKNGQMIIGQGSQPLPQIVLRVKDGIVQATGVDGLIYGRHTNIV